MATRVRCRDLGGFGTLQALLIKMRFDPLPSFDFRRAILAGVEFAAEPFEPGGQLKLIEWQLLPALVDHCRV